ncbi:MAG: hypothetical protein ABEJ36_02490 [Candidatus Nanosalina sp.]
MARRTYGEDRRKTVERSVDDREVIEAFVEELGAETHAENVLEGEADPEELEATARYELVHPYEGGNFADALMRGEEVTARVEFYVEPESSETVVYEGHVTYDAADIFHPASVVGLDEVEGSGQDHDDMSDGSDIDVGSEPDSDPAVAMTD